MSRNNDVNCFCKLAKILSSKLVLDFMLFFSRKCLKVVPFCWHQSNCKTLPGSSFKPYFWSTQALQLNLLPPYSLRSQGDKLKKDWNYDICPDLTIEAKVNIGLWFNQESYTFLIYLVCLWVKSSPSLCCIPREKCQSRSIGR